MRSLVAVLVMTTLAHAAPKKPGKGFWRVLVQPDKKWVLEDTMPLFSDNTPETERKPNVLTITTYDVRKIGDADVARLRWSLNGSDDNALQYTNAGPLTQIAVTDAGAYLFYASADDAKITAALTGKPSRSDPPKPYKPTKLNEGRYLDNTDGLVCMGYQALPDDPPCEEVCGATVCIDATEGIVSIDGSWAPDFHDYAANSPALQASKQAYLARMEKAAKARPRPKKAKKHR